jgi:hypothetical protein
MRVTEQPNVSLYAGNVMGRLANRTHQTEVFQRVPPLSATSYRPVAAGSFHRRPHPTRPNLTPTFHLNLVTLRDLRTLTL